MRKKVIPIIHIIQTNHINNSQYNKKIKKSKGFKEIIYRNIKISNKQHKFMNKIKINIVIAKIIYQYQRTLIINQIFKPKYKNLIRTNNKTSFIVPLEPPNHLIKLLTMINQN